MDYRRLSEDEIRRLERQGCSAEDWSRVEVRAETDVSRIERAHFSGLVRIGAFRRTITLRGGAAARAGISDAVLHNVSVGDDCYINKVYAANYDVAPLCMLVDSELTTEEGAASFGAGVRLNVGDETGGRQIVIHPHMGAQEAFLQAFANVGLRGQAARQTAKSGRGAVGRASRVERCARIKNVRIGEECRIEGATEMENGTVGDGAFVGGGVTARNFIFEAHSRIADGARLTNCYVGQASCVENGFTATHSFFSSNCQAENGEACSLFAGPFTVTHHKSSLLIGALCSFFNAGSGTNQSNHAYKLGPIHYGLLERGCKTASGAHIVWPARIGAFSLVMGRIPARTNTRAYPFSYLFGGTERGYIVPAIALRSIGTLRDARKWPQRDGRPAGNAADDCICFEPFTPYVLQRMADAAHSLSLLALTMEKEGKNETQLAGCGLFVTLDNAKRGAELYRLAVDFVLSEMARKRTAACNDGECVMPSALPACKEWCDVMGLQTPVTEIKKMLNDVAAGLINSPQQLAARLKCLLLHTDDFAWAWACGYLHSAYPDNDFPSALRRATEQGNAARNRLYELIRADALRDIRGGEQMEYGLLGGEADAEQEKHALRDKLLRSALDILDETFHKKHN